MCKIRYSEFEMPELLKQEIAEGLEEIPDNRGSIFSNRAELQRARVIEVKVSELIEKISPEEIMLLNGLDRTSKIFLLRRKGVISF